MSEWFRLDANMRGHPKLGRLARVLGIARSHAVGLWVSLLCWVCSFARDGVLTSFEPAELAEAAQWEGDPAAFVSAAEDVGLLDRVGDELFVHDWDATNAKSAEEAKQKAADRARRYRERKKSSRVTERDASRVTERDEGGDGSRPTNERTDERTDVQTDACEKRDAAADERAEDEEASSPGFELVPLDGPPIAVSAQSVLALYKEELSDWPAPPRGFPTIDDGRAVTALSKAFGADGVDWWRGVFRRAKRSTFLNKKARARLRWIGVHMFLDADKLGNLLAGQYDDDERTVPKESDVAAEAAWARVAAETKKAPDRRAPLDELDPRARRALKAIGGYSAVGRSTTRALPSLRKTFVEAFRATKPKDASEPEGEVGAVIASIADRRAM